MSEVEAATRTPGQAPLPGAAPFVWAAWAGLLLLALLYVGKFGSRLPFYDDWTLVPVLTGNQPLTPAYLWAPFHEHRVPLPKLALYALGRLSGLDFRAGMVLDVALMGGLAFALLRTARRLRGHAHFADAFLPLLVLGLAQWESFLIEYALNLVGSTVVAGAYLLLLAGSGPRPSPRRAAWMAGCLVLLPLFGAGGLVLVPPLAAWPAFVGARHWRAADAPSRRQGRLAVGLVAAALLLAGLYLAGLRSPGQAPASPKPAAVLASGLQVLATLGGTSALPFAPLRAGVVPAALLAGGGAWLAAWWRRPGERVVLLGFLGFLVGMTCLVGAVAWGRAAYVGSDGPAPRYATLMVPLGCWLYFLWGRYGGAAGGPAAQMALFALAAVTFAPNLRAAFDAGHGRRLVLRGFEADLAAGLPPALLAERGAGRVFPAEGREYLAGCLAMLRDARAGAFRQLPPDLPLRAAALPASALSWHDMALAGGIARPVGADPALQITLPRPEFVCAVRLHYTYTNLLGSPDLFDVWWREGGRGPKVLLEAGPLDAGDRSVTVWVNDRSDGFRLVPRMKMFALRVSRVEVLLPVETGSGAPDRLSSWFASSPTRGGWAQPRPDEKMDGVAPAFAGLLRVSR